MIEYRDRGDLPIPHCGPLYHPGTWTLQQAEDITEPRRVTEMPTMCTCGRNFDYCVTATKAYDAVVNQKQARSVPAQSQKTIGAFARGAKAGFSAESWFKRFLEIDKAMKRDGY